jgi:hypothetical protein
LKDWQAAEKDFSAFFFLKIEEALSPILFFVAHYAGSFQNP